jgi:hypothetical protein
VKVLEWVSPQWLLDLQISDGNPIIPFAMWPACDATLGGKAMLALKLIHLIEDHSDQLADLLATRIRHSSRTKTFSNVSESELRQRVREVYCQLGEWLLSKTEAEFAQYYTKLGARRAEQGVVLSDFMWSMVIAKESLWDFLRSEAVADRALELLGEFEMLRLLDRFFERAMYFGVRGYEEHLERRAAA